VHICAALLGASHEQQHVFQVVSIHSALLPDLYQGSIGLCEFHQPITEIGMVYLCS